MRGTADGSRWPNGVMEWLQTVLQERLAPELQLRGDSPGWTVLGLPGDSRQIAMEVDTETFDRDGSEQPLSWWDSQAEGWQAPLGLPIPAPGKCPLPRPLITGDASEGFRLQYDVPGLIYWALSRREEVGRKDLDRFQRFPSTSSHAGRRGYLDRPFVDEWLIILRQLVQRLWPGLRLSQSCYSLHPSHDVDRPSRYAFCNNWEFFRAMAGDVVMRRRPLDVLRAPWVRWTTQNKLHPQDPFNTFDWLMSQSERYGLSSTFFFKAGRTDPRFDDAFTLRHPAIGDLLRRIYQRGHHIGLHPSFLTWLDPITLCAEAAHLRNHCQKLGIPLECLPSRMHYLRWSMPETPRALCQANVRVDATLGYADSAGFRTGTCHAYPAIDPTTHEVMPLRIQPLIVMDSALRAQTQDLVQARSVLLRLREACQRVRGQFWILWHNSEMWETRWRAVYCSAFEN